MAHKQNANKRRPQTRRGFIKGTLTAAGFMAAVKKRCPASAAVPAKSGDGAASPSAPSEGFIFPRKKARWWKALPEKKVRCELCPRACEVADRERGFCGVRENEGGVYYTLVWGRASAANVDPIEKKPLFHFLPGTKTLSIATAGCNMECKFCQNWELSQFRPEQLQAYHLPPAKLIELAVVKKFPSIAYTYNEPVVFSEYLADAAAEGRRRGIHSVMISNGYIEEKPLKALCDVLSAIKIDLKAFSNDFYKKYTKSTIQPVLDTLKFISKSKLWYEIVVLLVPTLNDGEKEITELCKWVAGELGPHVPLHFSRFHPTYKLKNLPPTPHATLKKAHAIARQAGLHHVYLGNIPGDKTESTFCPGCKKNIIHRYGYYVGDTHVNKGRCTFCNRQIPGVWSP